MNTIIQEEDKKGGSHNTVVSTAAGTSSGKTNVEIDVYRYVVVGVVIALFIGFIGILIAIDIYIVDGYRSKEATYQDLIDKVNEQEIKIDNLNKVMNLLCKTWRKDCPPI